MTGQSITLLASIPSPSSGTLSIGPLELRAYGLMIALGVIAGVWLLGKQLEIDNPNGYRPGTTFHQRATRPAWAATSKHGGTSR